MGRILKVAVRNGNINIVKYIVDHFDKKVLNQSDFYGKQFFLKRVRYFPQSRL